MTDELDKTMPGYRDRQTDGRFEPGDLILGRYKVLAELGKGGMGIVYKCEDQTSHVCYAVKTLAPELTDSKWEMEEILYNFQLVQKLHHPNIANYNALELDPQTNRYFLVMEYVEGEDLRYWLRSRRREGADLQQVIPPVVRQIAQALDYAHSQKIVHRDIKPGNIMIDGVGNVKVLDFGLAAQIHSSLSRVSIQSVNEASTCGTIPYMAPEQWRGGEAEAASDQYALAATVYEMFSGRPPFDSADKDILRNCTLHEAPRPLKDVSPAIRSAVEKALAKEPEDRFNSCADFAAALGGAKMGKAKKTASGKSGGGAWKWIAAVIALALLAGGVYFVVNEQDRKELVVKRYRKAAEQGDAKAQNNLGDCYYKGHGVTQDYKEAVKWYRKAADQGLASAQCNLGVCYEYGHGVEKNLTEA
ncbi:MAG: protein kinase, partial [Lentisphaeria bacterium]|nr:protein kinase [Lentisphaeria bacterium]